MRKRKEDIGLSPYELKFRGPQRSRDVEMTLFDIDSEEGENGDEECNDFLEKCGHSGTSFTSFFIQALACVVILTYFPVPIKFFMTKNAVLREQHLPARQEGKELSP